jgi:hypothetical protein
MTPAAAAFWIFFTEIVAQAFAVPTPSANKVRVKRHLTMMVKVYDKKIRPKAMMAQNDLTMTFGI